MEDEAVAGAPVAFHALAKPAGAACNLACKYCFYLSKADLYPGSGLRMSAEVQEQYIRQTLAAHTVPEVTIAWQGGEPTLIGLDFFRRSIEIEERYRKPGTVVRNTIQTNGLLLDDEWCEFLHRHDFLVGISIDGPRELHDAYRVDAAGRPTFDRVMRAVALLHRHGVEVNSLTTVHAANAEHGLEVYRFLRDEAGMRYVQFIPIVEWRDDGEPSTPPGVSARSVGREQYGRFLTAIFDEWVRRDVAQVYAQTFDATLSSWLGLPASLCVFAETCGAAPVVEHNGDVYSCDHFVAARYRLGNIMERPLGDMVCSAAQAAFGQGKRDTLPPVCLRCGVRFACNGGCPKDRYRGASPDQPALNYLCAGYRAFFEHVREPMRTMAQLLRQGRPAAEIMSVLSLEGASRQAAYRRCGRNDPCPCGSGRKLKHCHGREGAAHRTS
ncbi:MAG: anaerobic sulfatase maturase [Anaerolineae bacterium]